MLIGGNDDIVVRGLGTRVFTGSDADTILIDHASFGSLHGTGLTRVLDFSEEDSIVVNMPNLLRDDLIVEQLATGSLVRVREDAITIAEQLGSRDLMLIQGYQPKLWLIVYLQRQN